MASNQRGEGRIGCLVVLILMSVFVYGCFKVVPVYLDKLDFEDGLGRIASRAGVESSSEEVVLQRVQALAAGKEFEVDPTSVKVIRTSKFTSTPEIRIRVTYWRKVEFPGFDYVFHFESSVSSFVGRL